MSITDELMWGNRSLTDGYVDMDTLDNGIIFDNRGTKKDIIEKYPRFPELKRKLLSIGGKYVIYSNEPFLEALLEKGNIFNNPVSHIAEPVEGACHPLVTGFKIKYGEENGLKVGYGWALGANGYWRQHSWIMDDGTIIETSSFTGIEYFGIVMDDISDEMVDRFCDYWKDWLEVDKL